MANDSILPEGENLRRAVRWISEQDKATMRVIEEASVRFDLSPVDADFLLRHFIQKETPSS